MDDVLDAKRYTINAFGDTFHVIVSFKDDGEPCQIFVNFASEIDNRERMLIDTLCRSWTVLLESGMSGPEIVRLTCPKTQMNDKFLNEMIMILTNEGR